MTRPQTLEDLTEDELRQKRDDAQAIADSARHELFVRRLARRKRLAEFIQQHRDEFLEFFELGGCKRPSEAVDRLIDDPEHWRPMAYAQKDDA